VFVVFAELDEQIHPIEVWPFFVYALYNASELEAAHGAGVEKLKLCKKLIDRNVVGGGIALDCEEEAEESVGGTHLHGFNKYIGLIKSSQITICAFR
jgi:hypothetical protein